MQRLQNRVTREMTTSSSSSPSATTPLNNESRSLPGSNRDPPVRCPSLRYVPVPLHPHGQARSPSRPVTNNGGRQESEVGYLYPSDDNDSASATSQIKSSDYVYFKSSNIQNSYDVCDVWKYDIIQRIFLKIEVLYLHNILVHYQ